MENEEGRDSIVIQEVLPSDACIKPERFILRVYYARQDSLRCQKHKYLARIWPFISIDNSERVNQSTQDKCGIEQNCPLADLASIEEGICTLVIFQHSVCKVDSFLCKVMERVFSLEIKFDVKRTAFKALIVSILVN